MDDNKSFRTTTFVIPNTLHTQLRIMCTLTNKSMGEFIRMAIIEQIKTLKEKNEQL
jgi:predicted component of type VI protein secretion system